MLKKRIYEVDILRGIAFLAVVLQHSLAGFIYASNLKVYEAIPSAIILNSIRFAVPMFVVITGFSLYYSDKGDDYFTFLKKRFKQIILPYLLWTVIYDVFMFFIAGMKTKGIYEVFIKYLEYVFTGTASYHLWYMVMIIQFYLLYPLFKIVLNKNKTKVFNTISLGIFFIVHLMLLYWYNFKAGAMYDNVTGIFRSILTYSDRLFIMWIFYFVIGGYFALYFEEVKKYLYKFRILIGVLFLTSLSYVMMKMIETAYYNNEGGYIVNHFLGSPLNTIMFPLLLFSTLLLYPIAEYILNKRKILSEKLINVGKYSFGAYLVHALVLHYVNSTIKMFVPWFYIKIILSVIITATLSIMFTKLLSKSNSKLLLCLCGISKKPKKVEEKKNSYSL